MENTIYSQWTDIVQSVSPLNCLSDYTKSLVQSNPFFTSPLHQWLYTIQRNHQVITGGNFKLMQTTAALFLDSLLISRGYCTMRGHLPPSTPDDLQ